MPEIPSQPIPESPFANLEMAGDESLNIRQYLALFWHWAWLIALAALLAGGVAYLVSRQITPVYQISTTLLVNDSPSNKASDYNSLLASERLTRTYSQMIASEDVLVQAAGDLGLSIPVEDLKDMVSVQPVRDTQLIQIQIESSDPPQAVALANHLVEVFASQLKEIQSARFSQSKSSLETQMADIQNQIDDYAAQLAESGDPAEKDSLEGKIADYRQIYSTLLQSYEEVRLSEAQSVSSVVQIQAATIPSDPIRPRKLLNSLLAAVLAGLLAGGAIIAREALDDTLKSQEDVNRQLGLPVLGVIGHHSGEKEALATLAAPRSPEAEAFRTLRTNVQYASVDRPLRRLLVTSTEPGEGKTTIAANLAVALAQNGRRVVLLDCDFRRPTIHRRLALTNQDGLSQLFFEQEHGLNGTVRPAGVDNLGVLTSGPLPPNPAELLGSQRMLALLDELDGRADVLVLDTPPALAVADASILAPHVDGVLLVVKPGETRREVARQAVAQLRRVKANILGVVLNNLDGGMSRYGRYSYYHSSQEYQTPYYDTETSDNGSSKSKGSRYRVSKTDG